MRSEQYRNSTDFEHAMFIMNHTHDMLFTISGGQSFDRISCVVDTGDRREEYEVYDYFKKLQYAVAFMSDAETDEAEQIKILSNGKADMIHLIENFKRLTEGIEDSQSYKLDGFIKSYDGLLEMAHAELQAKVLRNQIDTNNNVRSTNNTIRRLTRVTVVASILSAVAAIAGIFISLSNNEEMLIKRQDKKLEELEVKVARIDSQLYSQIEQINFLKNLTRYSIDTIK